MEPIAYFVSEFCERYVISKSSFYREVTARRLRIYKRGKRSMVEVAEAERWHASLTKGDTFNLPLRESVSTTSLTP